MSEENKPVGNITPLTQSPVSQEPVSQGWGLSDIMALPEPSSPTQTRTFAAAGREWSVTIKTDGRTSAERFYELTLCLSRAFEDKRLSVLTPGPTPKKIEIESSAYLGQLYILAAAAVSPTLSPEEWAIFGHKVGGRVMESILDWATTENGITDYLMDLQARNAKNSSSAEESKPLSSAPASKSAKRSPNKP